MPSSLKVGSGVPSWSMMVVPCRQAGSDGAAQGLRRDGVDAGVGAPVHVADGRTVAALSMRATLRHTSPMVSMAVARRRSMAANCERLMAMCRARAPPPAGGRPM